MQTLFCKTFRARQLFSSFKSRLFTIGLVLFSSCLLIGFCKIQRPITIWMIGDSTMSIKAKNKYPETGWGLPFSQAFDEHVKVENKAMNGRSTKSFISENRWNNVADSIRPGDFVLIQFGHNDEKIDKPGVGTAIEEYKKNLSTFVSETRKKGGYPVLLTPIARRHFVNGQLVETHGQYPEAIRTVADSLDVAVIDMTVQTNQLLGDLGEQASARLFLHLEKGHENYPDGVTDNTHLNAYGAEVIAKMVIEEMNNKQLPLSKYLKKNK